MMGFGLQPRKRPIDGSSNLPRATIDHEYGYVRYRIRDRGVKKLLKTTDQFVSKVYSDIARYLTEEQAQSKEELTDLKVVNYEVGSFVASHFVASFPHIKGWN